ncbi:MAG: hypothetical protein K0R54_743 [Clostridiaceae bacterium]|jgi:hypothetical protein|nr:hypothetical protein [Clostridiaceae bacterium]
MKVEELIDIIFDKIIIYKTNNEEFEDIYKGDKNNIPIKILEMKVRSIGASKKGVIDIQVF